MKESRNKEYSYKEIKIKEIVTDRVFINCKFYQCMLSYMQQNNPADASILRNSQFINCYATEATGQSGGIFENVLIENLKIHGVLFCTNVLFKNTKFKGKIGKISLSSKILEVDLIYNNIGQRHKITKEEIEKFEAFRIDFYSKIDIALDISEAEFTYCEIDPSIPANLIKINHENQVLIKYEKINSIDWENNTTIMESILKYVFLDSVTRKSDVIFVASVLDKKKNNEHMKLIRMLKEKGICESA